MGENLTADSVTFQSTLPARGATEIAYIDLSKGDISIHAPRTGSDFTKNSLTKLLKNISIHAPRTGSDTASTAGTRTAKRFQSTLPARGATPGNTAGRSPEKISIHAPRTGSDDGR